MGTRLGVRICLMSRGALLVALLVAMALTLLAGVAAAPRPAAAAGDCTIDASMDTEEQAFLTLINNYRVQNSLPKLHLSYMLSRASAWKSKDLAVNAYFAHDDLSRTWVQRIRDCSYGYNTFLGENIAAGYVTAQSVFDGWKASPGHNANMLGANYTSIGIGRYFVAGSPFGWYWTTDFGGYDDGYTTKATDAPLRPLTPPTLTPTAVPTPAAPRGARQKPASPPFSWWWRLNPLLFW